VRAAGQQLPEVAGGIEHLLQVVQDEQPAAVAQLLDQDLQGRGRALQASPHRPGNASQDLLGPGSRFQRDEHDLIEAVPQQFAGGQCQAGLADPPRPGEGHQPHPGPAQQPGDLVDGLLPPHQRGGTNRQPA
jgi:hypothetical protein